MKPHEWPADELAQKIAEAMCAMLSEHAVRMETESPYELRGPVNAFDAWVHETVPDVHMVPLPNGEECLDMLRGYIRARYPDDAEAMVRRLAEIMQTMEPY
jgi:hypothetical protein